jgi:hypothetical protein
MTDSWEGLRHPHFRKRSSNRTPRRQRRPASRSRLHRESDGRTPNARSRELLCRLGGAKFSEQELYDYATNFIRTQLATVQGASIPLPYGGKTRAVSVDLDPNKLQAYNISPQEVANAINQQSVVLPSGTAKIGKREYDVLINGSTNTIPALNNLPVKQVNGATISRIMAQYAGGSHLHPARNLFLCAGFARNRPDDQHYDSGRLGIGRWHSGR